MPDKPEPKFTSRFRAVLTPEQIKRMEIAIKCGATHADLRSRFGLGVHVYLKQRRNGGDS